MIRSEKLFRKDYSIVIIPQEAERVRKIVISSFLAKFLLSSLVIALFSLTFIFYDSKELRGKFSELNSLPPPAHSHQAEIFFFAEKISRMEEQLRQLQVTEAGLSKELMEIKDMKKKIRGPFGRPLRGPYLMDRHPSFLEEQISLFEQERTQIASYLHQELLKLRKLAIQREQNLKEIQESLKAQKSILLATPSLWPVLGRITSGFGETRQVTSSGGTRPHIGLDIGAPVGAPILAPADGVVSFVGRTPDYGRLICIDHGHGFSTRYGHLQEFSVKTGSKIRKGQIIGKVGLSGKTNGPHLHYEVLIDGRSVNPVPYLPQPP